ncbi:hypothetical protein D9M73_175990 [compost metagenome]
MAAASSSAPVAAAVAVLAAGVGAWAATSLLSLLSPQPASEMAMASRLAVARGIRIMAKSWVERLDRCAMHTRNFDIMRRICIFCKGVADKSLCANFILAIK